MEKCKQTIKSLAKGMAIFTAANMIYISGLILANNLSDKYSRSIQNQSELELILKEKRKKLNIDDSIIIKCRISKNKSDDTTSERLGYKKYGITLSPKYHSLATLNHELYHVVDGTCDAFAITKNSTRSITKRALKYLYVYEPKAVVYSITGIKL